MLGQCNKMIIFDLPSFVFKINLAYVIKRCNSLQKIYGLLAAGPYDFGLFWNFNMGKQILPFVIETKRFGSV